MKKLAFMIAVAFNLHFATAQTNTATPDYGDSPTSTLPTPGNLTTKFNSDFPNNNPTWTSEGSYYRADFTDAANNTDNYVTYDNNANVVMRGNRLATEKYPEGINTYYIKTYPKEKYEVWTREDGSGNQSYYVDRKSEVVWFDKDGHYKNTIKSKAKSKKTSK